MSLAAADLDPPPRRGRRRAPRAPFVVEEGAQGYAVRAREAGGLGLLALQALALATGALLAAGALGLIVAGGEGTGWMRVGLAAHLGTAAALLLWFASRGSLAEVQLDLARGELREVVRHRVGRASVLARHGLDAVEAVEVEPAPGAGQGTLRLRLGGSDDLIFLARGPLGPIEALRRRLASDLTMGSQGRLGRLAGDERGPGGWPEAA